MRTNRTLRVLLSAGAAALALGLTACVTPGGAAAGGAAKAGGAAQAGVVANSAPIRRWALPANQSPAGGDKAQMLKKADINGVLREARTQQVNDPASAAASLTLVLDDIVAGDAPAARARFEAFPNKAAAGDFVEAWVILAEGDADAAARRAERAGNLSPQLALLQAALVYEGAGNFIASRAAYAKLLRELDLTPPPEEEARSLEEALRQLQAPQTWAMVYRAALSAHRAGEVQEARRLYGVAESFAPRASEVARNLARLNAGQAPAEAPLTRTSAIGTWALFLSEEFSRVEGLQKMMADPTPNNDLVSPAGMVFAQVGIAYAPDADDWKLRTARDLFAINAVEGAQRIVAEVPRGSLFAPEANLLRGYMALRATDMAGAANFAKAAMAAAPDRYDIAMAAAQIYSDAGRDRETIDAFNVAARVAPEAKDKAAALVGRGYAHLFFGRIDQAIADARAALAADRKDENVRIVAIAIFKDRDDTWAEGVALGRELLREHPDSVARLNQLGYTLIHREEGLEEGFRLLHRGASLNPTDYAVVDSFGWAYYLYGDFEEALRLVARANELTGNNPNAEILDHLADIYWRLNRKDEARETWQKALAAGPEAPRRRDIEAKLRNGLTAPAPVKRPTPAVEEVVPREKQDT